jgi:hypothetical protein
MNKYATLLLSYILFISYASKGLASYKPVLDYKVDLKNRIIVNELRQAYYSSDKHCSANYVKPFLRRGMNYTDHSNITNITLNKSSIRFYNTSNPIKSSKYSRNY